MLLKYKIMKYILVIFIGVLFLSCKGRQDQSSGSESGNEDTYQEATLSAEFRSFYDKFLSDSVFQMQSIDFPLNGLPNLSEVEDYENIKWQEENWIIHKPLNDPNNEFLVETETLGASLVIETISHKSGSFQMVRRFAKTTDGWKLIYFQDLNIMSTE